MSITTCTKQILKEQHIQGKQYDNQEGNGEKANFTESSS
jgi:hypothetical protein